MAVTRAMRGSPFSIFAVRAPSVTMVDRAAQGDDAAAVESKALGRLFSRLDIRHCSKLRRVETYGGGTPGHQGPGQIAPRGRERSTNTGSSHPGRPALTTCFTAISTASRRSRSKGVPRLTSSASALPTKSAISSGATVIDGMAPAARSRFAVKFCATALVMQWIRGAPLADAQNRVDRQLSVMRRQVVLMRAICIIKLPPPA